MNELPSPLTPNSETASAEDPAPEPTPADRTVPEAPAVEVPSKGRVLLLEDDANFREVLNDFLTENGYHVVAVKNGAEGVREVMSGQFSLILCDLMMPMLPGDMFYRAVERISPDLCTRFVFMSGHRNDPKMNEFIKAIGGLIIQKPFKLNDLLGLIDFADVRNTVHSIFDGVPDAPAETPVALPVDAVPPAARPPSRPAPPVEREPSAPTPSAPVAPIPVAPRTMAPPPAPDHGAFVFALAGMFLSFGLAAVLGFQYFDAQQDAAAANATRLTLESEWRLLEPQRDASLSLRPALKNAEAGPARIAANRALPRWTRSLSAIATAAGRPIEVLDLQALATPDQPGAGEVRFRGFAAGPDARREADRFRQSAERTLAREAPGRPVSLRFEKLDDLPATENQPARAEFIIVATIGPATPTAGSKEGA